MGLLDKFVKKVFLPDPVEESSVQEETPQLTAEQIFEEIETLENAPYMLPDVVDGQKVKYHYQGVKCHHTWQYSGQYGKLLTDLNWKVGEPLRLTYTEDGSYGERYYLFKAGIREPLAFITNSTLQTMVDKWTVAMKPVKACFTGLNHDGDLYIELAFYGYVKRSRGE